MGLVLISSGVLPEERAHTFIYATNDVAQRGIDIAQQDPRVRQIFDDAIARKGTVTIAAVQPTVMVDRHTGESSYSSAGQVVITSNWQTIGGTAYSEPQSFAAVADRSLESHQQLWHVLVDVDNGQVTQINQQANGVLSDTIILRLYVLR